MGLQLHNRYGTTEQPSAGSRSRDRASSSRTHRPCLTGTRVTRAARVWSRRFDLARRKVTVNQYVRFVIEHPGAVALLSQQSQDN